MIELNIQEAKTHLSEYLAKLKHGETIVLCKRNQPIAEIRPLRALPDAPRRGWSREGYLRGPGELLRTRCRNRSSRTSTASGFLIPSP